MRNKSTKMAAQPQATVDPYDHLELVLNPDGSLSRNATWYPNIPPTPTPTPDADQSTAVLSKDITFNQSHHTWFRLYRPTHIPHRHKLPLIFYYHGGGFIVASAASSFYHAFCSDLAAHLPAVVISVDYRLAPEHRLPAAYDDAVEALHWVKSNWAHVDWLRDHADLSNCFLMGSSAGGNMAYHVGLRVAATSHDLEPIVVRGLVLREPFFGGTETAPSEMTVTEDPFLRPGVTDMMWELSLPIGSGREHEYCNIRVGEGAKAVENIKELGWKVLVTGFELDPIHDRAVEAVEFMREKGLEVEARFMEGGSHSADLFDPSLAKSMHAALKTFVSNSVLLCG